MQITRRPAISALSLGVPGAVENAWPDLRRAVIQTGAQFDWRNLARSNAQMASRSAGLADDSHYRLRVGIRSR